MESNKYKYWDIVQEVPEGWKIDKTVGSPLHNHVFITNGKSVLNGQKRALLRIEEKQVEPEITVVKTIPVIIKEEPKLEEKQQPHFPAQTVNILARKKFQEQLLKEIMFDLMVCEIEGWDKLEYIKELKKLINGILIPNSSKKGVANKYQLGIWNYDEKLIIS